MSSSNSPCAACKFLRRKCTPECIFAPYFPPDQPQKFASVHRVFGASNVAKLLNELSTSRRNDAVTSLAYEAQERLRDPVYGCVSLISYYQQKLKMYQYQLYNAKKELSGYVGPSAMMPIIQHPSVIQAPYGLQMPHPAGGAQLVIRDQQTNPDQEMVRAYEYQQQLLQHRQAQATAQTQASIDQGGPGPVTVAGYEQMAGWGYYPNPYQLQQQEQLQQHLQQHHHHQFQQLQQEEQYAEGEEGRREQPLIHQFEIQEQPQLHHFEIDQQLLVQQQQNLEDDEGKREQPLIHQIQGEHDQEIDSHFLVHQPQQQHFEGEDESGVDPFS